MIKLKGILLVFTLFFSLLVVGQHEQTQIRISNLQDDVFKQSSIEPLEEVSFTIKIFFNGGEERTLVHHNHSLNSVTDDNVFTEEGELFLIEGIINEIEVRSFVRGENDCGVDDPPICIEIVRQTSESIPVASNICISDSYDSGFRFVSNSPNPNTSGSIRHIVEFDYEINPIVTIPNPINDVRGFGDTFQISATPGLNANVYNWQYQIANKDSLPSDAGWNDMPVPNESTVDVLPISFMGDDFDVALNNANDVYFRVASCASFSSNAVAYSLRRSAPHITSADEKPIKCFGGSDGEVRLYFDRQIDASIGETYGFALQGISNFEEVNRNVNDITSFNVESGTGNFFLDINDLPEGNYQINMIGGDENLNYFTGDSTHTRTITVENPPSQVDFSAEKLNDVSCNNGPENTSDDDGALNIEAFGGHPGNFEYLIREEGSSSGNWEPIASSNGAITINNLSKGNYEIKVRKRLDIGGICIAGEFAPNGDRIDDKTISIEIDEPPTPLEVVENSVALIEPNAYGFSNGSIVLKVSGGTPGTNGYYYEWIKNNDDGSTEVTTSGDVLLDATNSYYIELNSVPAGSYSILVRDRNYNSDSGNAINIGCEIQGGPYILEQPERLEVLIEEVKSISCNTNNLSVPANFDDDLVGDGELIAHASGGIQIPDETLFINIENVDGEIIEYNANNRPYIYVWKKRNEETNDYEELTLSLNDSILRNREVGEYAVNIIDLNGITIGEYIFDANGNPTSVNPIDTVYNLEEPPSIQLSFEKENISCSGGNTGSVSVLIEGGDAPYDITWEGIEDKSQILQNLFEGIYTVYVTDAKGCKVSGNVTIEQPNGLNIEVVEKINPTCFNGSDGIISVEVTGGTPPYNLTWNTLEKTAAISGLSSGNYILDLEDANGCKASTQVTLNDPEQFTIDIGADRTLCLAQTHIINLDSEYTIGATYVWESDNGFTSNSSLVELSESGTYRVIVTSSLGCVATDEVTIQVSDQPIDSYFLLTTQSFTNQEIILVNVSDPIGNRVEWIIPEDAEIVSESNEKLVLLFENEGVYDVNLRSYQGECFEDYTKTIIVEEQENLQDIGDSETPFIEELLVIYNSGRGQFTMKLSIKEEAEVSVKIISLITSQVVNTLRINNSKEYLEPFDLNNLPSGLYLLLVETPRGDEIRKIIIQ